MRQAILDIISNIEETKFQSILQSLKENNKTKLNTLIEQIRNSFYPAFFKLNIPIFCVQGIADEMVPASLYPK